MARIAFLTAALMKYPGGDPRLQDFVARFDAVFAAAEEFEGYITQPHKDGTIDEPTTPLPGFDQIEWDQRSILTYSLWQNLESVYAFTYTGPHGDALKNRGKWFPRPERPGFVAWWIADDHIPAWSEICERYEMLTQQGPTPEAFNFARPYGPDGKPTKINRQLFQEKAALHQPQRFSSTSEL